MTDPLISTWASNTMGRTPEKRAISVAFVNVLGQVGNIIAPVSGKRHLFRHDHSADQQYFFLPEEETTGYRLAFILMMCMAVLAITSALGLKLYLTRSNRKLLRRSQEQGTVYQPYLT